MVSRPVWCPGHRVQICNGGAGRWPLRRTALHSGADLITSVRQLRCPWIRLQASPVKVAGMFQQPSASDRPLSYCGEMGCVACGGRNSACRQAVGPGHSRRVASPGQVFGAAWLNLTGNWPPSANPGMARTWPARGGFGLISTARILTADEGGRSHDVESKSNRMVALSPEIGAGGWDPPSLRSRNFGFRHRAVHRQESASLQTSMPSVAQKAMVASSSSTSIFAADQHCVPVGRRREQQTANSPPMLVRPGPEY